MHRKCKNNTQTRQLIWRENFVRIYPYQKNSRRIKNSGEIGDIFYYPSTNDIYVSVSFEVLKSAVEKMKKKFFLPLKNNDSLALWKFHLCLSERTRNTCTILKCICVCVMTMFTFVESHFFLSSEPTIPSGNCNNCTHFTILCYNFFSTHIIASFSREISWYILNVLILYAVYYYYTSKFTPKMENSTVRNA